MVKQDYSSIPCDQSCDQKRRLCHEDVHVRYSRPGLTLEMEYNPATEGIRYQTINGKVPDAPQLEATGLPVQRVPWLGSNE